MHKGLDVSIYAKPELFPAPLEVDRFLYLHSFAIKLVGNNCFRPLSRWIGSYTNLEEFAKAIGRDVFPSPREVDRFLYVLQSIRKLLEEAVSVPSRGG